jgi:nucleotide-binding universal stress UspA family protein
LPLFAIRSCRCKKFWLSPTIFWSVQGKYLQVLPEPLTAAIIADMQPGRSAATLNSPETGLAQHSFPLHIAMENAASRPRQEKCMFKHILVTTDGSPVSLHAANAAIYLAKLSAARVTAFHVAPAYKTTMQGSEQQAAQYVTLAEYDERVRQRAERYLGEIRTLAEGAGVAFDGRYAMSDFPVEAIVKAIDQYGCDTVVIGSRRSEGAGKLGSVAQKVLVGARVPVVVT